MINPDNHLLHHDKTDPDFEISEIRNSLLVSPYNTPEEKRFFAENIQIRRVAKGTFLLKEDQAIKCAYHVYKGCVREFYYKNGEEKTSAFYTVSDSLTDDGNHQKQMPSGINWECSTECIVSILTFEVEKEMYRRFPRLESQCRMGIEKMYSDYKAAVHRFLASSPEERYEHLMNTKPEVFQFVPLYQVASYLGIKPESLSRIRRRLRNFSKSTRSPDK